MSDAEPRSTHSTNSDLEDPNSPPSSVAVSEENLAALLRAMMSSTEPEAQVLAEDANAAQVIAASEPSVTALQTYASRPAIVANPVAPAVESSPVRVSGETENRSPIARSGMSPAPALMPQAPAGRVNISEGAAKPYEKLSLNRLPEAAPRKAISRESAPLISAPPVATTKMAAPSDHSENPLRTRLAIGLVVGAVIASLGGSIFWARAHSSKAPRVLAAAAKDNVPLQMRVELLGNGLIDVRWNPQSAMIAQARDGRLVITEPNQPSRTLALDAEQLRTGHLTYQSAAESIQFGLEVADRSGAVAKESILAMQSPVSPPPLTGTAAKTLPTQTVTAKAQNTPTASAVEDVPPPSQPKIRTFVAPAARQNTVQRAVVDAPPTSANGPVILPAVGLPVSQAALLPPPTKDGSGQQRDGSVEQQVRVESNVEAANLIKKVIPVYPQLAKSTRIQGIVRFTAHIGKDGRILNLKFASGPPVLVDAASTAVKQWVYRPTLLNGQPVEVITQIDVNFTLHENSH